MTDAYKCDKCGEFDKRTEHRPVSAEGDLIYDAFDTAFGRGRSRIELCFDCKREFEDVVARWFVGPENKTHRQELREEMDIVPSGT